MGDSNSVWALVDICVCIELEKQKWKKPGEGGWFYF